VNGKFRGDWGFNLASASAYGLAIPHELPFLDDLFRRVFPKVRHVTERELFPYLERVHGLDRESAENLPLLELIDLLEGEVQDSSPLSASAKPKAKSVSKDEADSILRRLADENPAAIQGASKEKLAEVVRLQTGKNCSDSTIGNTKIWKENLSPRRAKVFTTLDKDHYENIAKVTRDLAKEAEVQRLIEASTLPKKQKAALSDALELGTMTEAAVIQALNVMRGGST
jgi:hypothetical protein